MTDITDELDDLSDSSASAGMPSALEEALSNGWLEIWYQPKIHLKRKFLAGAEALARIRHPQDGVLWPEHFLPGIDDAGMAALTEFMLCSAMRNWASFADAGFNLHLSINLPASMLSKLPIAEIVARDRPASNAWPGLILDVSEEQIARDIALVQKIAVSLKACGVAIAIDDFGAGYSSFASLRELPFAEIKVDGSFVKNCATDATNAAICQTAIDLAHRFGSVAVAENIETMTDLQALTAMGCDFGQGMLVAPPMPEQHFLELLRQRASKPRPQGEPPIPAAGSAA
jgi:EAL domain-containing protein (putative c-di-GMP-specific phosphodiesterase class I)